MDYPYPRTFSEYEGYATQTDRKSGRHAVPFALQGLFGEAGGLLTQVKKHQRDKLLSAVHRQSVLEELGDTLWYLTDVAKQVGTSLSELATALPPSRVPVARSAEHIAFTDIHAGDLTHAPEDGESYTSALAELAASVGLLLPLYTQGTDPEPFKHALLKVLVVYIRVAHQSGISLAEIASSNLKKVLGRWPTLEFSQFEDKFDADFPGHERLPRRLEVKIIEYERGTGKSYVMQSCCGVHIGDRLTDNIVVSDHYRFHDVFHYAYAAVLHWSPVTRSLFKLKRKSQPSIDEAQDGARAAVTEEGVSAFIFNRAKHQNYFAGVSEGELSYDLLKFVQEFVRGFEVDQCPAWLWERAILQGFEGFRFLQNNGSALITLDLDSRNLSVSGLS